LRSRVDIPDDFCVRSEIIRALGSVFGIARRTVVTFRAPLNGEERRTLDEIIRFFERPGDIRGIRAEGAQTGLTNNKTEIIADCHATARYFFIFEQRIENAARYPDRTEARWGHVH